MKKKIPTINELLEREVRRPHVDIEWLSKLSSSEFWAWCDREADIIRFRGGTSREAISLHIETEIQNQEKTYQLLKEMVVNNNGLKKAKNRIELDGRLTGKEVITFDIETLPSVRGAVLQEYGVVNKNGRIYESKALDLKDSYKNLDWMHGEIWERKYTKRSI